MKRRSRRVSDRPVSKIPPPIRPRGSRSPTSSLSISLTDLDHLIDPQSLSGFSSGAPLALNITHHIPTPPEEEEEESIEDPILLFEHRRKVLFSEHLNGSPHLISVSLKSDRVKPPPDPYFIENREYFRYLRTEPSSTPHRSAPTSPELPPPRKIASSKGVHGSPSNDLDFEFTQSWIESVSMDLDEDYPAGFLAELPDAPPPIPRSGKTKTKRTVREPEKPEDPVEQAFQRVLAEGDPQRLGMKEPSAHELALEWGFEDHAIGETIRKVIHRGEQRK